MAATPREAAAGCDFVMACVGNDDDLRSVVTGRRRRAGRDERGRDLRRSHHRFGHRDARTGRGRRKGIGWVDAPVSGGQAGAENGQLAIMCGGEEAHFAAAEPVIAPIPRRPCISATSAPGQLTKMVNQVCIAGAIQSISEGLYFAMKAGLDPKKVADLVSQGRAGRGNWPTARAPWSTMKFNHGFAVDWMRKDLGIALEQANEMGLSLPVTASSISSMPRCSNWAAGGGTPPA
jgi:3-hydroxyisobutyrate dehydrogenase